MTKVLLICGSKNQTEMMHKISVALAQELEGVPGPVVCRFAPYYSSSSLVKWVSRRGWADFSIVGERYRRSALSYCLSNRLHVDEEGSFNDYDLVVTCSDLIIPKNIRNLPIVLVQEGMTDPENLAYHVVRALRLPRWMASTSTTGLSHAYRRFCVASEGYQEFFARKGIPREKIAVTGIPNFDNVGELTRNSLPQRNYVLVATSDTRETFKLDNRRGFIRRCIEIANGRKLIFKLHPNENLERSRKEIQAVAPGAEVIQEGNIDLLIANCDVLITQYSTVVYVGLALGKEVHSYFDVKALARMTPIQNGGTSARNIAKVCREVLA